MSSPSSANGQYGGNVAKKSRIRIPTSCSTCRAKKIKCDRKRPTCTHCRTKENGQSCKYETQRWPRNAPTAEAAVTMLQDEIVDLKDKIRSLQATVEMQRKVSIDGSIASTNTSPKSLFEGDGNKENFYRGDDKVNLENLSCRFGVKNLKMLYFGPTFYMFLIVNDPYTVDILSNYFQDQVRKFRLKSTSLEMQNDAIYGQPGPSIDDCSKPAIMTPESPPELPVLPSLSIVNRLIQRFFKLCYIFAPFIDERVFMNEIGHIFRKKEKIEVEDLRYRSSTIAILLIMLRFAYLTLPLKKYHSQTLAGSDLELILLIENNNVNISASFTEYAQYIIISHRVYERIDFRKIQAILFLRVYRMHCPEDEDKFSGSNILIAIAAQMARFHGLHKDPRNISVLTIDSTDIHLWRKTWASLVYLDCTQAFEFGLPLLIQDDGSDTKYPFKDSLGEFWSANEGLERSFMIKFLVSKLTRQSVQIFNRGINTIKLQVVEELLFEFHNILDNIIRSFEALSNLKSLTVEMSEAAYEVVLRMTVLHNVFILYYLLSLSTTGEVKEKYLCRAVESAFTLMGVGLQFAENPSVLVSFEFETLVASQIWNPIKAVVCFLSGLLHKSLNGEGSLIEASKSFTPTSGTSFFWEKLDFKDEEACCRSMLAAFDESYRIIVQRSVKYFHCYMLCFTFKIILDYFHSNYPEKIQIISPFSYEKNDKLQEQTRVDAFWNAADLDDDFTFEEFLTYLNYNPDPFINEIT